MQIDLNKHLNFSNKSKFAIDSIIEVQCDKEIDEEGKTNSESIASESTQNISSGITSSDEEQQV